MLQSDSCECRDYRFKRLTFLVGLDKEEDHQLMSVGLLLVFDEFFFSDSIFSTIEELLFASYSITGFFIVLHMLLSREQERRIAHVYIFIILSMYVSRRVLMHLLSKTRVCHTRHYFCRRWFRRKKIKIYAELSWFYSDRFLRLTSGVRCQGQWHSTLHWPTAAQPFTFIHSNNYFLQQWNETFRCVRTCTMCCNVWNIISTVTAVSWGRQ